MSENIAHVNVTDADPGRARLIAGVMEHLACFLQTGRPRSAHLALMLLDRLARDAESDVDTALAEHCRHLRDVLEDRLAAHASPPQPVPEKTRVAVAANGKRAPWLTWENLSEVA